MLDVELCLLCSGLGGIVLNVWIKFLWLLPCWCNGVWCSGMQLANHEKLLWQKCNCWWYEIYWIWCHFNDWLYPYQLPWTHVSFWFAERRPKIFDLQKKIEICISKYLHFNQSIAELRQLCFKNVIFSYEIF